MISTWKRSLGAIAMLFCFGLSVPAVGGPLHICLSEWLQLNEVKSNCCDHETRHETSELEHRDSCCFDLEELPDAQTPSTSVDLPDVPALELADWFIPTPRVDEGALSRPDHPVMIRGPGSPSSFRATLEIWRL